MKIHVLEIVLDPWILLVQICTELKYINQEVVISEVVEIGLFYDGSAKALVGSAGK